jgi:hypothetical protein
VSSRLTCEIVKSCSARPILLVDVDGVVSLFGFATAPPAGLIATSPEGIPDFPSPQAGSRLSRLAATIGSWAGPATRPAEERVTRLERWTPRA